MLIATLTNYLLTHSLLFFHLTRYMEYVWFTMKSTILLNRTEAKFILFGCIATLGLTLSLIQGVPKKNVFRNVVLFWLAGVWTFKIWVLLGSKNIHAITRCPQCVYTCVHPLVSLHTSEWAFDQRFCYFPKDNFILGHPV